MAYLLSTMRLPRLFRLSCLMLVAPVFSGEIEAPIYRENDFVSYIPDSPHFVMFFAPWCSHCQRLVPLWNRLASYFSKSSSPVTVAKVDCTKDTPLCAQEDIKAYPTMRYFDRGKKATYRGQRDISDIVTFTLKQIENSRKTFSTEGELEVELDTYKFEKELQHGLKIVNFYAPWCPHCKKLAPTWQKLAEEYQFFADVKILQVNCEKERLTCKKQEITGYPKIIAFYHGSKEAMYTGDRSLENLKDFVKDLINTHLHSHKPHDPIKESGSFPSDPVAIEVTENTDDEVFNLRLDIFDLAVSSGKTFIYFYAPWCKYCKEFSPIWKKLAKEVVLKGIMIKMAKVDCTNEEDLCRELSVPSFPTIRLYKSKFSFQEYKGDRTVSDLLSFINKHLRDEL